MRIPFTKMQGAGNDFVVLDEMRAPLGLKPAHYRFLADRHFGVGADQILTVRPPPAPGVDFAYAIHNADGGEVEHCGNGARCFLSFVRARGYTTQNVVTVQTVERLLQLHWQPDGRVTVDMGAPVFDLARIPFDATGLVPQNAGLWQKWGLNTATAPVDIDKAATISVAVVSMGNPHAVLVVDDVDAAPVATLGPWVQSQSAFPSGVNVGFMQVVSRTQIRLRVYERGAGETLACGTGACAAVVCGIRLGLLDGSADAHIGAPIDVQARGGRLSVEWQGGASPVRMTGPATFVFQGEIDIPDAL